MKKKILVTGGCGFIGSNFIRMVLGTGKYKIINLDVLTYAGNLENLKDLENHKDYSFVKGDVCDIKIVSSVMKGIDIVVHFAAESHVDRSISGPEIFIKANVLGTQVMLESALENNIKKFLYISTDEVYGSIKEGLSKEGDMLEPTSPYSASKTSGDLLSQAYFKTYKLPILIVRSSNNFGPYQYPEKLIPLFVTNLIEEKKVPVYGDGKNIRDWIFVEDNCSAILHLIENGIIGEVYNIGGGNQKTNIEITKMILQELNKDESFIQFVEDRLGHDFRYALDSNKLKMTGWKPRYCFEEALKKTIKWYADNKPWWQKLKNKH